MGDVSIESEQQRLLGAERLDGARSTKADAASAEQRLNFSGTWLLKGIDGFLASMDHGFLKRKAAQSMGYGAGRITEEIQHNGDTFAVKTTMPTGVNENKLRTDGTEQDATDPDGMPVRTILKWEGADLSSSSKNPK